MNAVAAIRDGWRQRVLNRIDDLSVRKILVMRWREEGVITDDETASLIRNNGMEAA